MSPEEKKTVATPARVESENDIEKPTDVPDFDVGSFINNVLGDNVNSESQEE